MKIMTKGLVVAVVYGLFTALAEAHCDTMNGPLIPEAQAALEKGDVTPILKWVSEENEAEIKDAFTKAVAVRSKGPEAKQLADHYFLETLVRIHRAGEGAPYTGIKDEPVPPIVAIADQSLVNGSAEEMITKMTGHMAGAIREKFNKALETKKHAEESVAAGREYVEAYVQYIHYVEGLRDTIMASGGHHAAESAGTHIEHKE
ncbi:MAG: DUF6448 family protein [Kiritimatiellales bacterium]|jgi:hypothetical protein